MLLKILAHNFIKQRKTKKEFNFAISHVLPIKSIWEEKVFKVIENIEIPKATGIDKFPGGFHGTKV